MSRRHKLDHDQVVDIEMQTVMHKKRSLLHKAHHTVVQDSDFTTVLKGGATRLLLGTLARQLLLRDTSDKCRVHGCLNGRVRCRLRLLIHGCVFQRNWEGSVNSREDVYKTDCSEKSAHQRVRSPHSGSNAIQAQPLRQTVTSLTHGNGADTSKLREGCCHTCVRAVSRSGNQPAVRVAAQLHSDHGWLVQRQWAWF